MACGIRGAAVAPTLVASFRSPSNFINFSSSSITTTTKTPAFPPLLLKTSKSNLICRAEEEYKFPDAIPEFADSETEKFESHLQKKLSKKDIWRFPR